MSVESSLRQPQTLEPGTEKLRLLGKTARRSLLRTCLSALVVSSLGCRNESSVVDQVSEAPDTPVARTVLGSQSPRVAARKVSETTEPAKRLLADMLERYRGATAYTDQASVQLTYRQNEMPQTDSAPLSVRYIAPGRLALNAYSLQLACEAGQLSAQVADSETQDLDGQRLQQPLPAEKLSLDAIYADPLVVRFATAGLGGPPPQLELLLGATPLSGLLEGETELSLQQPDRIGAHHCHRLLIRSSPLQYVLWIDQQSLLLRRIELPLAMVPGLVEDVTIRDAKLSIELSNASFSPSGPESFVLPARANAIVVPRFVPLPPPLPSPLLGQTPRAFVFHALTPKGEASFRVTEHGSDRKLTVLLWVARHEGSQAAATELQTLVDQMPAEARAATRFVIVMAESGTPTGKTLNSWDVRLPWVDDTQAVGRDVFGVETAPTLCVLSSRNHVEWFQHRVEPGALLALPQVLLDLLAGVPVGQTLRDEHAANQQAYRAALSH